MPFRCPFFEVIYSILRQALYVPLPTHAAVTSNHEFFQLRRGTPAKLEFLPEMRPPPSQDALHTLQAVYLLGPLLEALLYGTV